MVKFMKHYVTDGTVKARVFYSDGEINKKMPDGSRKQVSCITLYARDYGGALGKVFPKAYENNSDSMTDYFEEGHVRIFPEDAIYEAAKARIAANKAADAEKASKKAAAKRSAFNAGGYLDDFNYVGSRFHY